ncbi:MAG: dephospho-CoA kinase [Pyrinomonadaceae bacterium]
MLEVGLTGSIAVGKTFVADTLRELGCHVLDADQTSRDVVAKNTDGLAEIVREFGTDVLAADGGLDRKRLGLIVFADETKRKLLNSIVHPKVIEAQDAWIGQRVADDPDGIAVIDAALMIESGGYRRFAKIIVVWCESTIQFDRLVARDGLNPAEARMRIAAQMPQEEKKSYSDYLVDTSLGFAEARRQTEAVFAQLKGIC